MKYTSPVSGKCYNTSLHDWMNDEEITQFTETFSLTTFENTKAFKRMESENKTPISRFFAKETHIGSIKLET